MQADKITGGVGFKGKGVPPVVYSWKPRQRADGNKKDHPFYTGVLCYWGVAF